MLISPTYRKTNKIFVFTNIITYQKILHHYTFVTDIFHQHHDIHDVGPSFTDLFVTSILVTDVGDKINGDSFGHFGHHLVSIRLTFKTCHRHWNSVNIIHKSSPTLSHQYDDVINITMSPTEMSPTSYDQLKPQKSCESSVF